MRDILQFLIAPLVWFVAFGAIYGLHGVLCGQGQSGLVVNAALARAMLIGAYGIAVVVQVAILAALHAPRYASRSRFVRFVSRTTAWVGLVATVWSLLPVFVTSTCL